MNHIKQILVKATKGILLVIVSLIILINLFILLTGRFYLYKGIFHTYLQGKTGPGIYDLDVFPYSTIEADPDKALSRHSKYNAYKLKSAETKNLASTGTTAFLVLKNDSIVFEQYFEKHQIATVSNAFSAAKTVVSLLVGIALGEGKISSLDDPVGKYLPAYNDEAKRKLTVRHLLYMASGLSWTESGKDPLSNNAESYYGNDLENLVMSQTLVTEPGKEFNYQSGNSQLLGFIVERATGKKLSDYCEEKLWRPLGADLNAYWSMDRENGDEKSFCCLYASARDFARIGLLIMNQGFYNGKQIIPAAYMKEMVELAPIGTEEGIANNRYGLHIWLTSYQNKKIIYCRGIMGQYIVSIPEDKVVFVRLGQERKPNYTMEEMEKGIGKIEWIEHPRDLFEYLDVVKNVLSN